MNTSRLTTQLLGAAAALAAILTAPAAAQNKSLQVRIYSSLTPGINEPEARAVTRPVLNHVGKRVRVPFEHDIYKGTTSEDLFEFGKKLEDGTYHFGVVWGLEYGWLAERYKKLKINCVAHAAELEYPARTLLLVRRGMENSSLADLKGKRLAIYKTTPLMERVFLRKMLEDAGLRPQGYFQETENYEILRDAVAAVRQKQADCVILNATTYNRLQTAYPGLAAALAPLKVKSEVYPMPVVIGSPEVVNGLRQESRSLWLHIQKELVDMHTTPEGEDCVRFWRFQHFSVPDATYQQQVDRLVEKVPVRRLLSVE